MNRVAWPRRVAFVSLFLGLGSGVRAEVAPPTQSHRIVDRLDARRAISWQAESRESGGEFVLLRIGLTAREIARLPAVPGVHQYRFVDERADSGSLAIVYRLAYVESSGAVRPLHEAVVTERSFEEKTTLTDGGRTAKGFVSTVQGAPAPAERAELASSPIRFAGAPRPAPEPPPPWS